MDPVTAIYVASAIIGGMQQGAASAAQKKIADSNARLLEVRAAEVLKKGDRDAASLQDKVRAFEANQKVSYAAQGVNVNQSIALDTSMETARLAQIDSMKLKNNAWLNSWGIKYEMGQQIAAAEMNAAIGDAKTAQGFLNAGLNIATHNAKARSDKDVDTSTKKGEKTFIVGPDQNYKQKGLFD